MPCVHSKISLEVWSQRDFSRSQNIKPLMSFLLGTDCWKVTKKGSPEWLFSVFLYISTECKEPGLLIPPRAHCSSQKNPLVLGGRPLYPLQLSRVGAVGQTSALLGHGFQWEAPPGWDSPICAEAAAADEVLVLVSCTHPAPPQPAPVRALLSHLVKHSCRSVLAGWEGKSYLAQHTVGAP